MENYLGEIRMFGGNFAPRGWALCNGQLLSIAQNTALYSLLGTTFGGDGVTTFALPNVQGRIPVHAGQGPGLTNRTPGEASGTETVTLTTIQMPAHAHTVNASNAAASTTAHTPENNFPGIPGTSNIYDNVAAENVLMNQLSLAVSGGNQPHENMQPSLCVTFIIALEGIFPSRN